MHVCVRHVITQWVIQLPKGFAWMVRIMLMLYFSASLFDTVQLVRSTYVFFYFKKRSIPSSYSLSYSLAHWLTDLLPDLLTLPSGCHFITCTLIWIQISSFKKLPCPSRRIDRLRHCTMTWPLTLWFFFGPLQVFS